jgi:hypothetical protein
MMIRTGTNANGISGAGWHVEHAQPFTSPLQYDVNPGLTAAQPARPPVHGEHIQSRQASALLMSMSDIKEAGMRMSPVKITATIPPSTNSLMARKV